MDPFQDSQLMYDEDDEMMLNCIDLPPASPPPENIQYDSDTLEDACPTVMQPSVVENRLARNVNKIVVMLSKPQ